MLPFFRGCKYLTTKPRKLITAIDYFPKILTFASNPGIIIPHSHPHRHPSLGQVRLVRPVRLV